MAGIDTQLARDLRAAMQAQAAQDRHTNGVSPIWAQIAAVSGNTVTIRRMGNSDPDGYPNDKYYNVVGTVPAVDDWVVALSTLGGVIVVGSGAGGGGGGVTDHGALTGLADDDHTQYHTDARGDARYAGIAHVGAGGTAHANAVAGGAAGFLMGTDKTKLDGLGQHLTGVSDTTAITSFPKGVSTFEATATNGTWPAGVTAGTVVTLRSFDASEKSYQRFLAYTGFTEYIRWWNTTTPGWTVWIHPSDIPPGGSAGQFFKNFGSEVYDWEDLSSSEVIDTFTGTPDGTKYLKDDGTLAVPAGGGGSGYTPPWVRTGANTRYISWGDGNPFPTNLLLNNGLSPTRANINNVVSPGVLFRLPKSLTLATIYAPTLIAAVNSGLHVGIYRRSDSAFIASTNITGTVVGWSPGTVTGSPVLAADTDYWLLYHGGVNTGTVAFVRTPNTPFDTWIYGAPAAPLGIYDSGIPIQVLVSVTTQGTWPSTMPTPASYTVANRGAMLAILEGTAS